MRGEREWASATGGELPKDSTRRPYHLERQCPKQVDHEPRRNVVGGDFLRVHDDRAERAVTRAKIEHDVDRWEDVNEMTSASGLGGSDLSPQTRSPNQKSRQEKKIFWPDGTLYQSKPISSGKKKTRRRTQMTVARSKTRLAQRGVRANNVSERKGCRPKERSRPVACRLERT